MDKISPKKKSNDLEKALEELKKWKKENGIVDDDGTSVGGTTYQTATANKKITDLTKLHSLLAEQISDPSRLQGPTIEQKKGNVAERIEVHDRNVDAIKNNKTPDASLSESGIDQTTDIIVGDKSYQMKFCKDAKTTLAKIADPKYKDVRKLVPKEQYDDIIKLAKQRQDSALKSAEKHKQNGNTEKYEKAKQRAEKYKNVIETTEPSTTTTNQSKFEYKHPKLAESARVVGDIGKAGVSAALPAAAVAAAISGATSFYNVAKGDMDGTDALIQTGKTTVSAAANAFGVGAGGATISAATTKVAQKVSEEAAKSALETFAKSSAPTYIALAVIETSKSVWRYSQGKLTKGELALELGEKVVCTVISGVAGAVGEAIGGPVGSIVLSTAAYMATSAMYRGVVDAIKWAKTADEARKLMPLLDELYNSLSTQRIELEKFLEEQKLIREKILTESFNILEQALTIDDIDNFALSLSSIIIVYGQEIEFKNLEELDEFMNNESTVLKI